MNIHSFVASLSTSNATTSNSQVTSNFQLPKLATVRKLVGSWTLGVGWELDLGSWLGVGPWELVGSWELRSWGLDSERSFPASENRLPLEERDAEHDQQYPYPRHHQGHAEQHGNGQDERSGNLAGQHHDDRQDEDDGDLLRAAGVVHARRHRNRALQRGQRPQGTDDAEEDGGAAGEQRLEDRVGSERRDEREKPGHPDRLGDERRQERGEHLRDEQFRRRQRRRQQRLQRAPVLLADDRVGRERDGADDRRDEEQHQELLQEERLRRLLRVER